MMMDNKEGTQMSSVCVKPQQNKKSRSTKIAAIYILYKFQFLLYFCTFFAMHHCCREWHFNSQCWTKWEKWTHQQQMTHLTLSATCKQTFTYGTGTLVLSPAHCHIQNKIFTHGCWFICVTMCVIKKTKIKINENSQSDVVDGDMWLPIV